MKRKCENCKKILERNAFISIEKGGDERIYSYFFCTECDKYTVELFRDLFVTGGSEISTFQRDKEEGNKEVLLILDCPSPEDKNCKCSTHKDYFKSE
uniref:Uncharacterized protein n=1 Tax=uncultured marine group II/III euryarchaeote KM3_195_B08 TaxID=1457970 RepID=A0A075GY79_9EURY|nr:hypothetical protein [uncultured marine group II/III euryarchaeote KM3_195_B08]